ncbi:Nn.00g008070.m01.CDS01 [Neocucurbitaria sp. VM-36]
MSEHTELRKSPAKVTDDSQLQDSSDQYVDTGIVKLGPILEAESRHGPVFRREIFDAAYSAYQSIKDIGCETSRIMSDGTESRILDEKVTLLDINGEERSVYVMKEGNRIEHDGVPHVSKRVWRYNCIQCLGHERAEFKKENLCSYDFGTRDVEVDGKDCFKEEDVIAKSGVWTKEWTNSEMYRRLTAFLEEHAGKTMQHIDRIICFGLGCFTTKWGQAAKRSYIQHLAACTVRDIIAQGQGGTPPKVYAQEPIYCAAGIAHIQQHFSIEVLDDPEGFRALDGNTFVISISPNVPVRQIAFGLTHEFGGPAGMFCNDIQSDGLECDGKGCEYQDGRWVCPYKTCEPSPGLWRYKMESMWMECSDKREENWFGEVGLYLKRKG